MIITYNRNNEIDPLLMNYLKLSHVTLFISKIVFLDLMRSFCISNAKRSEKLSNILTQLSEKKYCLTLKLLGEIKLAIYCISGGMDFWKKLLRNNFRER